MFLCVAVGSIVIKLVSHVFEADTLHGEDSHLCKEETDFHGLEFEKQFACIYKVRLSHMTYCI